jgi:hypothetical protein
LIFSFIVNLNNKIMISGKGILYTVLAAASAAVLAGSMLTKGERGQSLKKIGGSLQNFFGNKPTSKSPGSAPQVEGPSSFGHS